jgi:hypothetical protein
MSVVVVLPRPLGRMKKQGNSTFLRRTDQSLRATVERLLLYCEGLVGVEEGEEGAVPPHAAKWFLAPSSLQGPYALRP